MRNALLIVHVLGSILLVGPVTVASSVFPRRALAALGDATQLSAARDAHRTASGYGLASLIVPGVGGALAGYSNLWGATWLRVAVGVYVCATVLLLVVIVPRQRQVLTHFNQLDADCNDDARSSGDIRSDLSVLRMSTGVFSLLWVGVLVLMVTKPW